VTARGWWRLAAFGLLGVLLGAAATAVWIWTGPLVSGPGPFSEQGESLDVAVGLAALVGMLVTGRNSRA
jgi:hypothetical protein